jgi:hypothetical protein
MKRMKHPDHGFHHAYNLLEEETMRKAGWVEDVPEPMPASPNPTELVGESPIEAAKFDDAPGEIAPGIAVTAPKRRGRPKKG